METSKGFIHIPVRERKDLIGDISVPCKTLLNTEIARIDSYGRLWSSFLKGKFSAGSKVRLTRKEDGFQVELIGNGYENYEKIKKKDAAFINSWDSSKQRTQIRKKGTCTSSFGSPGRFGHDSSKFYKSRLYEGIPSEIKETVYVENEIPQDYLNRIFCKSSERMDELPENSIHLMVTSPPYNVGKDYDKNFSLEEYRNLLRQVFKEVYRVLVTGGRACVNIANLGRKPYIPLHTWIIQDMLDIGFLMRGEIIWDKGSSAAASTAWGSWCSATNPTLRDVHEYILVFSKDTFSRPNLKDKKNTITREEFLEWSKSVWSFPAESASKIGHPAPFPIELPLRLIKLYTFEKDVVLDPFMGSGTTAIAALQTNRHYIGYEIIKEYVGIAEKRIKEFQSAQSQMKLSNFSV
ncbi:site-specific DNA-methyltransferase [Candidatus Bathyarchaeota archaeon]|nr:site-specific DNA-methyltransferase [Candidatus Bathyarchaeota archaeon]